MYLVGYLDKTIRSLVLIMPKMSGYAKTFKFKDGDKNNKLVSLHRNDKKLLEKYITFWIKTEDSKILNY